MCMDVIGKDAPLFQLNAVLPNLTYGTVSLDQNIKNKKWTLLIFYPFDFSPEAKEMLTAFSRRIRSFEQHQIMLCFVSVESVYTHRKLMESEQFQFALASDFTHQVGKDYGCYVNEDGSSYRGIYLIDDKGILLYGQRMCKPIPIEAQNYLDMVIQFQSLIQ